MKYNLSEKDIEIGKTSIITHPGFGTLAMEVKNITNGFVEGLVWEETGYYQFNMPEEYHGEYEYMNFPISCIKEIY